MALQPLHRRDPQKLSPRKLNLGQTCTAGDFRQGVVISHGAKIHKRCPVQVCDRDLLIPGAILYAE